jgi:hypothetical protein
LFRCPHCGKDYANPLTHVCRKRSDFKRRQKQHHQAQQRKPSRPSHDYERCRDEHCQRYPCRAYRDGHEAGYFEGEAKGFAAGYAAASGD